MWTHNSHNCPSHRGLAGQREDGLKLYMCGNVCVCSCVLYTTPHPPFLLLHSHGAELTRMNEGMVRNRARTSDYSRSELRDLDKKKLWRPSRSRNRQVHTTYNNSWLVLQNMSPSLVSARNNAPHCVTTTPAEFSVTAGSKTGANQICSQFVCWFSVWRL